MMPVMPNNPQANARTCATPQPLTVAVFGIPNCDTVKKARAWLKEHGVVHTFHDFKKAGVPVALLAGWIDAMGWEALLNRKGTTWRQLDPSAQAAVVDAVSAAALMQTHPSLVKRPVVVWGDDGLVTVGFDAAKFAGRLP